MHSVWAELFKAWLVKRSTYEVFYDFITKYTGIFVEKMREAFAMQKLLIFITTRNIGVFQMLTFDSKLTTLLVLNRPQIASLLFFFMDSYVSTCC